MAIYIIIAAVILIGSVFGFSSLNKSDNVLGKQSTVPRDTTKKVYSHDDVRKMLVDLAKQPVPKEMSMGAMCYDMAGPPARAEYVCPSCGSKTLYTENNTMTVQWELPKCREAMKKIKGLDMKLDETQFCKKCSGKKNDKPALCLVVSYDNEKPHRTCNISCDDIRLVDEFLSGNTKHIGERDSEEPLIKHSERIKLLLNILN
ncbi:MAG: hypothetical protein V2A54_16905 [Bacteroidota bacterium]